MILIAKSYAFSYACGIQNSFNIILYWIELDLQTSIHFSQQNENLVYRVMYKREPKNSNGSTLNDYNCIKVYVMGDFNFVTNILNNSTEIILIILLLQKYTRRVRRLQLITQQTCCRSSGNLCKKIPQSPQSSVTDQCDSRSNKHIIIIIQVLYYMNLQLTLSPHALLLYHNK